MTEALKDTPKNTPEEKNEICEKAFKSIYPSCECKDDNLLESLKDILGNDIAKKIKNVNRYDKPVLFISDNISLIRGAVSYLWYTQGQDMAPRVLSCSGLKEEEVLAKLNGDWIETAFKNIEFCTYLCGVLFFEDLNPYENILKQLWAKVEDNKDPGILVISMGNIGNLSQGLLGQFEVVKLESEKKDIAKAETESVTYNWSINSDKSEIYSNGSYAIKLSPLLFKIFNCLHKNKGKFVKNKTLEKCWGKKPAYDKYLVDEMNKLETSLKNELTKQGRNVQGKIIESKKNDNRKIIAYKLPI